MPLVTDIELPFLDVLAPGFRDEQHELTGAALDQSWVAMTSLGPVVLCDEHVRSLLRDHRLRTVTMRGSLELQGVSEGPFYERTVRALLAMDGPDHLRLRRLVAPALTPRAVSRLRPSMRETVEALVKATRGRAEVDVVEAIARPLPIAMICQLLGVPRDDGEQIARWAADEMALFDFDLVNDQDRIQAAYDGFDRYLEDLLERRRSDPGDDLISALLAAEEEGDRLTHDEVRMLVENLLVGGTDTTRHQLGLAVWALARHPDQWELLAADPALVPRAVEESLRWEATVDGVLRECVEDVELDGVTFPAGTVLMLGTQAANRDPVAHACPHAFDVTRQRHEPVLAFGSGAHHCPGASLARAELEEAVRVLVERWTGVELAGPVTWRPGSGLIGPAELRVARRWR
jgi:cytochrome P450